MGVDRSAYSRALEILVSRKYPFEELPRATARADDAAGVERLLLTMANQGPPGVQAPVHAVILPPKPVPGPGVEGAKL